MFLNQHYGHACSHSRRKHSETELKYFNISLQHLKMKLSNVFIKVKWGTKHTEAGLYCHC